MLALKDCFQDWKLILCIPENIRSAFLVKVGVVSVGLEVCESESGPGERNSFQESTRG